VIKFLIICFVILCFRLVLSGEFVFFLFVASVPEVVSGQNERSILHFYCQGGYIVHAAVGATIGADGSNDNCMQPFGRKATVVVVIVQLSAAVRWLSMVSMAGYGEYFVLLPVF
jgi:hypothetical protein